MKEEQQLVDPTMLEFIRSDRLDTAVDGAFGAHRVSIAKVSRFTNLLVDYPSITKPEAFNATPKHEVEYFIDAPGPPIHNQVRRLSSERLAIAKKEFEDLEALGIIRLSNTVGQNYRHVQLECSRGFSTERYSCGVCECISRGNQIILGADFV